MSLPGYPNTGGAAALFRSFFGNDREWSIWTHRVAPLTIGLSVRVDGEWRTHHRSALDSEELFTATAEEMLREHFGWQP